MKDSRGLAVYRFLSSVLAISCIIFFLYSFLCGLNYQRYTFSEYTGFDSQQVDAEEVGRLCLSLADELNITRAELGNETDLSTYSSDKFTYYSEHSVQIMQEVALIYPVLYREQFTPPKPVLSSKLLSNAGIAGLFFPFTMESNINIDVPFYSVPSTMTHELAHQCGFMREDEANYIAYLACMQSDDPLVYYSGLILAFEHSLSVLEKYDMILSFEVASQLSESVHKDLILLEEYWARTEGFLYDISSKINDLYLKANNQSDGIASYDRMVDLLLAQQRANSFTQSADKKHP